MVTGKAFRGSSRVRRTIRRAAVAVRDIGKAFRGSSRVGRAVRKNSSS